MAMKPEKPIWKITVNAGSKIVLRAPKRQPKRALGSIFRCCTSATSRCNNPHPGPLGTLTLLVQMGKMGA